MPSDPIRYPDPDIKIVDPRFQPMMLGNAAVERIATGCRFNEGPVWFGDLRCLIWSDIPNDRMMKWEEETGAISVFRKPSHYANGKHPRPPGAARDLRDGRAASDPHRARRDDHRAGRQLRRKEADRPQ
ncbi:MAG TPA: SMP-30/gluconolactonase/LRE family protein [Stellaceae bacterium]|nr:SMP-30/gluconolactonase/LRE family protein [Stellaceae bacterium]